MMMDPDGCLEKVLRLSAEMLTEDGLDELVRVVDLAELILALDEHLKNGGPLPSRWRR